MTTNPPRRPPEDARPQWATPPPSKPGAFVRSQRRQGITIAVGALVGVIAVFAGFMVLFAKIGSDPATPTDARPRTYLRPVADLSDVQTSCDSDSSPYVVVTVTNHASHSMGYDIVYTAYSKTGAKAGEAEIVFGLPAHGILLNRRLNGTGGCGPVIKLTSIRAYDSTGENGNPVFP